MQVCCINPTQCFFHWMLKCHSNAHGVQGATKHSPTNQHACMRQHYAGSNTTRGSCFLKAWYQYQIWSQRSRAQIPSQSTRGWAAFIQPYPAGGVCRVGDGRRSPQLHGSWELESLEALACSHDQGKRRETASCRVNRLLQKSRGVGRRGPNNGHTTFVSE